MTDPTFSVAAPKPSPHCGCIIFTPGLCLDLDVIPERSVVLLLNLAIFYTLVPYVVKETTPEIRAPVAPF